MSKLKHKNNYRFWHSPLMLLIILCFLIFFGYKIVDLILKEKETSNRRELILDRINELKDQKSNLEKDISRLDTDEGKEQIIREKYQVAREGEKVVNIIDEHQGDNVKSTKENHGFWNWLKSFLLNQKNK